VGSESNHLDSGCRQQFDDPLAFGDPQVNKRNTEHALNKGLFDRGPTGKPHRGKARPPNRLLDSSPIEEIARHHCHLR
jgi:hypothetical protein